ncbi:hypothetical protein IT398_02950 [Candidatus Nomurabacteria bacterium]|nr:hypothetical protein [Candidatus Nomurabacteria bacterium]
MEIKVNNLPESEIDLEGEIPTERFTAFRLVALKQLNNETKLDGFRTGHIPEKVLTEKLGEEKILLVMAELALQKIYPEILRDKKIDAIGRPAITLTKLAPGNPLGFKIKTAIKPSFTLPDYKKIAKEVNSQPTEEIKIEDKEIEEMTKTHPSETREKLETSLKQFKERQAREKRRLKIAEGIITDTTINLPKVLIETELDKMAEEMKAQISQMGLKFEDYLKHIKKEISDLKKDWNNEAQKRLKIGLVLAEIAKEEKLTPETAEVEKEVKHLQEHYKDTPEERLRHYVNEVLLVETVWKFLENQI